MTPIEKRVVRHGPMAMTVFAFAALFSATVVAGQKPHPFSGEAWGTGREADGPTERSITFHVLGLMKTKSGAT